MRWNTNRPWVTWLSIPVVFAIACSVTRGAERAAAVPDTVALHMAFDEKDATAFQKPPRIFYPETWFHFIGGNVAEKGISADLEAIAAAGIKGIQFFHGQFGGSWPGVEPQIKCLSDRWDVALDYIAEECRRLGLRFTMQNCPGWAMAGGPWITPQKAMRHLVWSRTDVDGGKEVTVRLPQPQPSQEEWRDYQDIAVVAFPTPEGDTGKALVPVSIKSNREDLPWEKCLRQAEGTKIYLEPSREPVWIEVTFAEKVKLRTVEFPSVRSFNHHWCYDPGVTITVQAVLPDGMKEVSRQEIPQSNWQDDRPISLACSEASTTTYRITIEHKHVMTFSYIQLFSAARKNNWEAEAAFVLRGLTREPHPQQSKATWIDPTKIVALSDKMDQEGNLHWKTPTGKWTVLRWGHVNSGMQNGPAPPEATGWECNKLSPVGAETHFAGYIGRLATDNGPVSDGLLQGMLLDSWECKTQTWTPGMEEQFSQLRGYSLHPWLPALAGYVIGDHEMTTRFLRDWRATINDLLVKNFFGRMAELGHENGLAISFETASGDVFPGDILEYYKYADVPMCEFWCPRSEAFVGSFNFKPVKPCVSAARMYGKPRVAAEAFTSFNLSWAEHPGILKPIADMHFAEGVTHLVFHTYTHNPRIDFLPPGTSFGSGIGSPFLRGQTWWSHMPEFTGYLARCNYLLERGQPVSDVLWYLGDEQDHKPAQDAPFPSGHHYDYCNPDALLKRLAVRDGMLVTPEGLRYRLLWLPNCPRMLPETFERLVSLVRDGAVLVGDPPQGLATLTGGAQAEQRFQMAVAALWGSQKDSSNKPAVRPLGKGQVICGMSLADALAMLKIEPDVEGDGVVWSHRHAEGADWYFVAAPNQKGFRGTLRFRATGNVEFWNPVTGTVTSGGVVRQEGETSLVALELPPSGSIFVVFRRDHGLVGNHVVRIEHDKTTVADAKTVCSITTEPQVVSAHDNSKGLLPRPVCELLDGGQLLAWEPGIYTTTYEDGTTSTWKTTEAKNIVISGPWNLAFPAGWGAPEKVKVDQLMSWTELNIPAEAKAFSGSVTYTTEFTLEPLVDGTHVELDLGQVEVIASVQVNGKPAGSVWLQPYRLDITSLVKPGSNQLTVKVTNTWFNRLVYDAGLEESARKTWTINGPPKDRSLLSAGLLGPVIVRIGQTVKASDAP